MKRSKTLTIILSLLAATVVYARVIKVPEEGPIQEAIDQLAQDGDTISVWGEGEPPFTYYGNFNFKNKSIFVVNRSYLPNQVPYDSSWDHVILNGRLGGTVMVVNGENAVLKGFTIEHGLAQCGGGILLSGGRVIKNHILYNHAIEIGGGIRCIAHSGSSSIIAIEDNLVEENSSEYSGAGMAVDNGGADVKIYRNVIRHNKARLYGGGIFLRFIPDYDYHPPASLPEGFSDNLIEGNYLEIPESGNGGGIYEMGWPYTARRNIIINNSPTGVYITEYNPEIPHLNFGSPADPGYNVLMNNGAYDFVADVAPSPWGYPIQVVGTYWGSVNTSYIMSRIVKPPPLRNFYYDPVAASGRYFSVNENSRCETDVIVTGDLKVEPDCELQIAPGKKLEFFLTPDHSEPGGNPSLCDLLVMGTLRALGTVGDTIIFRSKRYYNDPWMPGDWYGIRLYPQAQAEIEFCKLCAAYCGIDAESEVTLYLTNSLITGNLYSGLWMKGDTGVISGNTISYNGVYGIRLELPQRGAIFISDNQIMYNPISGISVKGSEATDAQFNIYRNTILSGYTGPMRSLYGIELLTVGNYVNVQDNPSVSGFHQAGIYLHGSSGSIQGNVILGNTFYGICCDWGARPVIRRNTINYSTVGVFSDQTSLPNLGVAYDDGGNNSILMENVIWVENQNEESLKAELNWWGTENPDEFDKFIGLVDYIPWLTEPPEGGQTGARVEMVKETKLYECQPNPFSDRTIIRYQIAQDGDVRLYIYDASGRVVKTLINTRQKLGAYSAVWNGRDENNRQLPNGVYFCEIRTLVLMLLKRRR